MSDRGPRSIVSKLDLLLIDGGTHCTTANRIYAEVVAPLLAEAADDQQRIMALFPDRATDGTLHHAVLIAVGAIRDFPAALAEAERRGAEKGGRQIAFEIRQTFADPTRERPLRPDAEFRTDMADDPEWCAMIADRYADEHRAGADHV